MKILVFLLALNFVFAYDPQSISENDMKNLQVIDKDIYELSSKNYEQENFTEILNFIWENRAIKIEPILERFNLGLTGFVGKRTRRNTSEDYNDLHPYSYIGLQLEYKIIDPKEAREKKEEIIKQRTTIASVLRNFYTNKIKISALEDRIKILQMKENRLKIRVKNAVSNLDDRLENLKILHTAKLDIATLKSQNDELKNNLLLLVKSEFVSYLNFRLSQ